MRHKKNIVVVVKGGVVSEVYSTDPNFSVTFIDADVKKDSDSLTDAEFDCVVKTETLGMTKIINDFN